MFLSTLLTASHLFTSKMTANQNDLVYFIPWCLSLCTYNFNRFLCTELSTLFNSNFVFLQTANTTSAHDAETRSSFLTLCEPTSSSSVATPSARSVPTDPICTRTGTASATTAVPSPSGFGPSVVWMSLRSNLPQTPGTRRKTFRTGWTSPGREVV